MSTEEILRFLEEFRLMYAEKAFKYREEAEFEPLETKPAGSDPRQNRKE